ncbi:pectate lyase superfamily protein-domain-containing protein [Xylariaceae sp. FL0594]|nr:pectate lyase superfamily protein-domain-containing protein [Xylariaceae sp. FL0594]
MAKPWILLTAVAVLVNGVTPPPDYMKDNVNNYWKSAPDKGSRRAPVLESPGGARIQTTPDEGRTSASSDNYWLSSLGSAGLMPFAGSGYQFFRNVKDFGAVGDGVTDDTAAINRAVASFSSGNTGTLRCGEECGSSTVLGAVVYFPPGTYLISSPIIQYYYTQFVGNPTSKPVIKGSNDFTGIALFDSDFYIPGGNGDEWYINQSNFYRQIRNFVFDMTGQNWTNYDNGQKYVPSGVHWQVGQATSITNCDFKMAVSADGFPATAVGIYMENGSGGFVSDLTFFGGNIGFLAGSQQFTANNLQFTSCLTAIYQQWNWGFTWKNIYVLSCYIAIDCTSYSGVTSQGTGSISVVDSHFNGVPYAITLARLGTEQPNIVLDNLLVENSASVVLISGGETIVAGSSGPLYFNSWASGYQYLPSGFGGKRSGFINPAPNKPAALLDGNGAYFTRSKPPYEAISAGSIVVATSHGISNDGTGDQTSAINSLLSSNVGSLIFFPGGVYLVKGTVKIPVGSKIVGSGWSQIMGTGSYFQDEKQPKGHGASGPKWGYWNHRNQLFTVKGPTAGAILMEWNVHESSQGSAAMWDSHFRVGGAQGSNLQLADCPTGASSVNANCKAASLLLHITAKASGYFENVWAWVADHDLDNPGNGQATESPDGIPLNVATQISIYAARGILIESQGPTWFYGSASEHAQMYQYQLSNAANVFFGHMQTETPYYQPNPVATKPYTAGKFPSDPTFSNCADDYCKSAWALRVLNSTNVFVYSAGFYSFFQNNELGCTAEEECQLAMIETNYAHGLWMYNIFTKGNVQIVSPCGDLPPLLFNSTTRNGYTSEIAAWLALSTTGENIGSGDGSGDGQDSSYVTIDPVIWNQPSASVTVSCSPPCTYVLPPLTLSTLTTFHFPPWSGPLEVGFPTTQTLTYLGSVTTTVGYVTIITTTTITIPDVTTSIIPVSNVPVTDSSTVIFPVPSIVPTPFVISEPSIISGTPIPKKTKSRTFIPPAWPGNGVTPTDSTPQPTTTTTTRSTHPTSGTSSTITAPGPGHTTTTRDSHFPPVTHKSGPPKPTCTRAGGCGHKCKIFCHHPCFLFCPDTHDDNWFDWDDPNRPSHPNPSNPDDPDDPDDCETATYSSCSTRCVTAATTSSCTSTCKDVVGCDTTGTSISAIYTLAPYWEPVFENWDHYNDVPAASDAWGIITSIFSHGTAPTTKPPSSTTTKRSTTSTKTTRTTKTTTTKGSSTTSKTTKTTTKPPTTTTKPTTTTTTTTTTSTYEIAVYQSPDCGAQGGNYKIIQGPLYDVNSPKVQCVPVYNSLPTTFQDDAGTYCRWYLNGGSSWTTCDAYQDVFEAKSWFLHSGNCVVWEADNDACDYSYGFWQYYYSGSGCYNFGDGDEGGQRPDVAYWASLKCYSGRPLDEAFSKANVAGGRAAAAEKLDYPTTDTLDKGQALCWSDYQEAAGGKDLLPAPRYQAIARDAAQKVVASFCEAGYTLQAGRNGSRVTQQYYADADMQGYPVIAEVSWAANQSGCGEKQDIELFRDGCLRAFDTAYLTCDDDKEVKGQEMLRYGGSYIYNTTTHGFIQLSIFSPTAMTSPLQGPLAGRYNITIDSNDLGGLLPPPSTSPSSLRGGGAWSPWKFSNALAH